MWYGALIFSALLANQTPEPYDRGRFTIKVANDDFGSGYDEAFTSGLEATFRVSPAPARSLRKLFPDSLKDSFAHEYWSLFLGQEIYTPALLISADLEILQRDRPYAGWLFGGLMWEGALRHSLFAEKGTSFLSARLTAGATGPQTQTEALQRYWHAFIRDVLRRRRLPDDPKGWGVYQVPNHVGVNLGLSYEGEIGRLEHSSSWFLENHGSRWGVRAGALVEGRLGNMWIDGAVGLSMYAGLLPEMVFAEFTPWTQQKGEKQDAFPLAIYFFGNGRLIGSAYNALLDGPPGYENNYPERHHILTKIEAGFAIRVSAVEFSFRHTMLSPELKKRPPGAVWLQNYGTINLSVAYF